MVNFRWPLWSSQFGLLVLVDRWDDLHFAHLILREPLHQVVAFLVLLLEVVYFWEGGLGVRQAVVEAEVVLV